MLLLDRYGMAVEITENVVETIVRNCGWEAVMRLLKSKGAGVEIARWSIGSCSRRGRGEWGLMMHLPTRGKITDSSSEQDERTGEGKV